MNAKELSRIYREMKTISDLDTLIPFFNVFLMDDLRELMKKRGDSIPATNGALNEIEQKWKAFCRLEPDFNPDGFAMLIKRKYPTIYKLWKGNG